jgi:hypothetical protein
VNRTRPEKALADQDIRPALWPSGVVRLSARALPRGPIRERYREEFLAELHGMTRRRQTRHSAGILSRAWALRMAVTTQGRLAGGTEDVTTRTSTRPLLCRLNLHHAWRTRSTEDGARYRRCARCGKDDVGDDGRGDARPLNTGGINGTSTGPAGWG